MTEVLDYLIIGAGPAGLQTAYFLQKQGHRYLILEQGNLPGAFFEKFPRHRQLISINKVHTGYDDPEVNLRWDWNSLICDNPEIRFTQHSQEYFPPADTLLRYLTEYAHHYNLNIRYNTQVNKIAKGQTFKIDASDGETYLAKVLIVATGVPQAYIPDIPGIEHVENYTSVSVDPKDFEGQRVLIIGKGNSAFETADNLVGTASLIHMLSPEPVKMAWRSHYVGHLRAVNNNILDTYQLKAQNALINAHAKAIHYKDNQYNVEIAYTLANDEVEVITYDRIIACTGFRFDASIFDKTCQPELAIKGRFPAMTSWYESTNVKDLFYAGTIMQMRDFKKKQSGFIHGFRHNIEFLANYLQQRYHNKDLPFTTYPLTAEMLTEKVISSVNKTVGLWQQTGYLCDVITIDKNTSQFHYYEGLPVDFVQENFAEVENYFVITLEFGQERIDKEFDVFAIERPHKEDYDKAHLSTGIHPIVKFFRKGESVLTHHVIEDFESIWKEEEHCFPIHKFFNNILVSFLKIKMTLSLEE
jgi:thioredoxin reductase